MDLVVFGGVKCSTFDMGASLVLHEDADAQSPEETHAGF
jgi:hypothetical protein